MYLSDGENEAPPPPLPDPSGGSMRTSSGIGGGKSPLLLKLKKGAIGNSSASSSTSRGRSVMKQSSPGSTSTPTSATQRAAARKASGTRRRSSSRTRSASVDPSGRVATASYVRQSATAAAAASSSTSTGSKSKSIRRTSSSSAGVQASSSRSIGSNGSGSTSSVRSRSSSRSKVRSSSSASSRNNEPANDVASATKSVARGSDPPGPMAAVTRRPVVGRRGPSASASPGKERIKKRAERERQRRQRQLSNEERQIVEAVQQQRVVAAVAASLLGTPPRAATASANAKTSNASATTGSTLSAPKYVNQSPELVRKPPATEGSSLVVNDKKTPSPVPKYVNQSPELARREESPSPVTSTGERKPIDVDAVGHSPSRPLTIGSDDIEAEAESCATSTATNDTVGATKDDDDNIEATDTGRDDDQIARSIETPPRMEEPNDATPLTSSNMAKEETTEEAEVEEEEKHETVEADNGADVGEIIEEIPIEANKDGGDDIMNGVPIQAIDNDAKEKDNTPADDNIGHNVDDDNDHQDDESAAGMKDSIQTVKSEDVDPKEAIGAALSLLNAPASIGSDVVKSKSFDDADEGTTEEVVATADNGAAPVELENGWTGTVTLRASPTPDNENNDATLPSAVTESKIEGNEIKSDVADKATGTNTDDIEGTMTMSTEEKFDDDVNITNIEGAVDNNQEKVESNDDNDEGEKQSDSTENSAFDLPSDSVDESVPDPASSAGMKRKDGALEDGDILATPRRKKMSGLRIEVSDSANDGMAQNPNSNVSALASPSASELIEHFEAKSPKAGSHGFVPPSPRSAANKGVQGALSPSREPFRFGAPPSKPVPANQLVVKTPPRHPPSRGGNPGSHATYDYPQRVQSPKWANSLSQSIAKGVCETQQSPRSNNESSGDTERILLEMKKMELRIEARMLHMEQHLEKQMRSKFKYLEARMDERMDEIQASLQVLLARDITEI